MATNSEGDFIKFGGVVRLKSGGPSLTVGDQATQGTGFNRQ